MWITKVFKTKQAQLDWIDKNKNKYQIEEVFINNAFGLDVKKLKRL